MASKAEGRENGLTSNWDPDSQDRGSFFGCCDQGAGVAGWTVTVEGFLGGSRSLGSGTGLGNRARKPDVWKRKEVVVFLTGLLCVLWRVIKVWVLKVSERRSNVYCYWRLVLVE